MMSDIYELQARYDSRLSFYGKAKVIETKKYLRLISYGTHVATWNKETKTLTIHRNYEYAPHGKYSQTTSRHIREFARQRGMYLTEVEVGQYQGY